MSDWPVPKWAKSKIKFEEINASLMDVCNTADDIITQLRAENEERGDEILRLNKWIDDCQSGMYINCVYCGHRYGPDDGKHLVSMREALHKHVESCPKHPMFKLKQQVERLKKILEDPRWQPYISDYFPLQLKKVIAMGIERFDELDNEITRELEEK